MQKGLLAFTLVLTTFTEVSFAGLVTVTPLVGYHQFADDTLMPSQSLDNAKQYGIALSYYPTSRWGWEAAYYQATTELVTTDDLRWKSADVSVIRRFYTYQAIQPYVLAGIGQAHYQATNQTIDNSTYGQLGAGIMWNINDLFALRTELRALSLQNTDTTDYVGLVGLELACGCLSSSSYENRHRVHKPDPIIPKESPKVLKVAAEPPLPAAIIPTLPRPPVILDADGDGVNDDADKCDNTPAKTKVNANGCPLVVDGDDDKDGIKN